MAKQKPELQLNLAVGQVQLLYSSLKGESLVKINLISVKVIHSSKSHAVIIMERCRQSRPASESGNPLAARIQPRSFGEPQLERSQPQPISRDFSHVDLFSHAPQRTPIQAKLTVGAANDQYEQEADRVAQQVMNMPAAATSQTVQREAVLEEDESLQTKPLPTTITPLVQREAMPLEEEEPIQAKFVQREGMPEEEEPLQTKPAPPRSLDGSFHSGADLESQLNQSRGGGSPLSEDVRSFMEPRFGANFSQVRVHTDAQADQLNRSVQARAFTTGQNVFFQQGEYNPGSRGGQELIAHELTHVVQQNGKGGVKEQYKTTTKGLTVDFKGRETNRTRIQRYRADGAPAPTQREAALKQKAKEACEAVPLLSKKFFYHVTTVNNMTAVNGILSTMTLKAQGGAGASTALGGQNGADLLAQSLGMAYATRDPATASEYFELHLSKARMTRDYGDSPVIIIIKWTTPWDLQPDPDEAPGAAVKSPHSFTLHSVLSQPVIDFADLQ